MVRFTEQSHAIIVVKARNPSTSLMPVYKITLYILGLLFIHQLSVAQSAIEPEFSADGQKVTIQGIAYQVANLDSGTVKFLRTIVNNKADLLNNQGVSAFKSGDYADAVRFFEQALKVRPEFNEAKMNKPAKKK